MASPQRERFETKLVAGSKVPYTTWTFALVPDAIPERWSRKRFNVRGTIDGKPFRGSVSRGEGHYRMLLRKELLAKLGLARGDSVVIEMGLDAKPRTTPVPPELQTLLDGDSELTDLFEALTPSLRRACSTYVAEAKRQETRDRRAARAPEGVRARLYPNQ